MQQESISILEWKVFVEKKRKKKMLVKLIWNDTDKLTLLISPNIKVNSFIIDEKEGYLFYDIEGKQIMNPIPSIIPSSALIDGQIPVKAISSGKVTLYGERLSKQEMNQLMH
ncbi:hypothetical protein [Oceanobacillus neutriphilus]|uniref:Uncharacterized protein n=1 Tax=Oceanobacillus neutriphilus TaxID=531815 RepID=A0ABQ2NSS8_9BACI|nr:hypothetical protein [Oceanobacillus neutriphilus]GGP09328.1 hypothetical protein GCM10011346_12950 [Oceanobacillus neutriphilus]